MAALTVEDVVRAVVAEAHGGSAAAPTGRRPGLRGPPADPALVLSAYDGVLEAYGVAEDADRSIYRALLTLTLMPQESWDDRVAGLAEVRGGGWGVGLGGVGGREPPLGPTAPTHRLRLTLRTFTPSSARPRSKAPWRARWCECPPPRRRGVIARRISPG
jgi:hypothetical protein